MEPNLSLHKGSTGGLSEPPRPDSIPLRRGHGIHVPEDDIYRGSEPQVPLPDSSYHILRVGSPEAGGSHSSSSSTSSASTRLVARAIARVVELAISRWARSSVSSTSSSSSTTSSAPSNVARRRPKRRRRASTATSTVHIDTAQRAFAREALENARRIPREFNLFLPDTSTVYDQKLSPLGPDILSPQQGPGSQLIRTTSLPLVLSNIEQAIRGGAKLRREQLKPPRANAHPPPHCPKVPHIRERSVLPAVIENPLVPGTEASRTPSPYQDQVASEGQSTPPERYPTPPVSSTMGPLPQVASKGRKGQKASPHHHPKPPIRASMGTDDLLNVDRGSRRASAQAAGGDHSGTTKQLATEYGSAPLSELWKKAWWLDVASPSWEDMRVLGTLLHLHPLTLEDILHQDPREKVEIFSRLGYYFIVVRSADLNMYANERDRPVQRQSVNTYPQNEKYSTLNVTNVYITVFREGICSFHFSDLSEHVNRIQTKVSNVDGEPTIMTSDHIAHSLMDSIVSAFIPMIKCIESEVESVDTLVSGTQDEDEWMRHWRNVDEQAKTTEAVVSLLRKTVTEENEMTNIGQKEEASPSTVLPPRRAWSRFWMRSSRIMGQVVCYLKSCLLALRSAGVSGLRGISFSGLSGRKKWHAIKMARMKTLMRMSDTRRTMTVLGRLLAPKNEVLGILRKRLVNAADLGAQLGDVQDHILTMQQSLEYYEQVLGHSQPTYLSGLSVHLAQAKNRSDATLWKLSVVLTATYCMQVVVGVFSMNIHLPHNHLPKDGPPGAPIGRFYVFGIVLSMNALVTILLLCVIWWWEEQARRKRKRKLQ